MTVVQSGLAAPDIAASVLVAPDPEAGDPPAPGPTPLTRIAVMSDIHVSPEEGATSPYAWVDHFLGRIISSLPDLILIAGDVFDRRDTSAEALLVGQHFIDTLAEGGRPVVVIGGNHDAETAHASSLKLPESVHWFGTDLASTLILPDYGIAVHGQSVASARDDRDVRPDYPVPVQGLTNIALLHTSISGMKSKRVCHPTTLDALRGDTRYDAWILGHVHERMLLHGSPLIVFPGGPHPRHASGLLGEHTPNTTPADAGFVMLEIGAPRATGFTQGTAGTPWTLGLTRTRSVF